jgi:hypothetical protein
MYLATVMWIHVVHRRIDWFAASQTPCSPSPQQCKKTSKEPHLSKVHVHFGFKYHLFPSGRQTDIVSHQPISNKPRSFRFSSG